MANFLQFIYDTVIKPKNERLLQEHKGEPVEQETNLVNLILRRGPEFIATVAFQHLHFQTNILHNISLQFPEQKIEYNFRNVYQNTLQFKIENYNFELLFKKIGDIDKILQLLSSLLLEKKVILIKEDISDVGILMQTLITLLSPFKWNYSVITNLPVNMIEALESPQPFLIGIQKSVWDSHCRVDTMDNIKEENFVIFDVDQLETRGLHDIYDSQTDTFSAIQLQKDFKKKYHQLLNLKDELISQLTQGNKKKRGENQYTEDKAEELYWVWFQLKIKQAMHHLYLNMVGNVQAAFKSKEILEEMDRKKGDNVACKDIFDFPKYLSMMTKEMKGEKLKFMEAFVEKQGFIVFIEDLHSYRRENTKRVTDKENSETYVKSEIQSFYSSLKFLIKIEQNELENNSTDYVQFSEKSLKQLRTRQNQQIDSVYLKYKSPVPFKFQFIMDEYVKQICIKNNKVTADEAKNMAKSEIQALALELLAEPESSEVIKSNFITEMKGIDYEKINEYLNRLKQKRTLEKEKRLKLKSQDSKNRGTSSRQDFVSDGDNMSDQRFQSEIKFGLHNRHGSSTTENLQILGNKKYSKSSRQGNINAQSQQQLLTQQRYLQSAASFVAGKKDGQHDKLHISLSRNQLDERGKSFQNGSTGHHNDLTKTINTAKVGPAYYEFLDEQTQSKEGQERVDVNRSLQLKMPSSMFKSQSNGNFMNGPKLFRNSQEAAHLQQFQRTLLSKQDSTENLYHQKVDPRLTQSRQSNQSSVRNMKPPKTTASNVFSPTKFKMMQQRSSQALPSLGVALRKEVSSPKNNFQASMSTLSMGKNSGNSCKEDPNLRKNSLAQAIVSTQPQMTTTQTFESQVYSQAGQNGQNAQGGRKSAQEVGSGKMTQLGFSQSQLQRRAFNQSQSTIALLNPMIIQSPSGLSSGIPSGGKLSNGLPTTNTPGADNSGSAPFHKHQSLGGAGTALQTSSNEGGSKKMSSPKNMTMQSPLQSKIPFSKKLSGISSNFSTKNLNFPLPGAPGSGQKTRNYGSPNKLKMGELKTSKTTREAGKTGTQQQNMKSPTRFSFLNNSKKSLDKSATTIMSKNHLQLPNSAKIKQQSSKLQQLLAKSNPNPDPHNTHTSSPNKSQSSPMIKSSSANKPPMTMAKPQGHSPPKFANAVSKKYVNDIKPSLPEDNKAQQKPKPKKTRIATLDLSGAIQKQKNTEIQNQYYQVNPSAMNYIKTDEDLQGEGEEERSNNSSISEELNKSRNSCYSNQLIKASYEGMKELRVPQSQRQDGIKFQTLQANDTFNLSSGGDDSSRFQAGIYAPITTQIDQGITYQTAQSDSINEGQNNKISVRYRYKNRKPSMRYDEQPKRESTLSDIAAAETERVQTDALQQSSHKNLYSKKQSMPVTGELAVHTQNYIQNSKAKKVKTQRYADQDQNYYVFNKPKPIKSQRSDMKSRKSIDSSQEPKPNLNPPNMYLQINQQQQNKAFEVYGNEQLLNHKANAEKQIQLTNTSNNQISDFSDQENVMDTSRYGLQANQPGIVEQIQSRQHLTAPKLSGDQKQKHLVQNYESANVKIQNSEASSAKPGLQSAKTVSQKSQNHQSVKKQVNDNGIVFQEAQKHMRQNLKQVGGSFKTEKYIGQQIGPVLNSTLKAASKYNVTGGTPDEMASPWIGQAHFSIQSKQSSDVKKFKDQPSEVKLRINEFNNENRSLFSPAAIKNTLKTGLKSPIQQKKALEQSAKNNSKQKTVQRVSITGNQKAMKKYYNDKLTSQKMSQMGERQFVPSFQNKLVARSSQLSVSKHEEDISMSLSMIENEFSILSSARNEVIFPPEQIVQRQKLQTLHAQHKQDSDPQGDYRMDLHKYYQPNQMRSPHIGDIDNEPRTPHNETKSPNWHNSMQNSQSR